MVAAKRDLRKPGVAYSQGQRKTDEFRVVSGDVYSFTNAVVNSEVNVAANSVLLKYTEALKDIVSPDGSKLLTLEAFSKLDMSSSLGSKTLVAARLLTNEDKTRGLRILTFNLSKDQRYGSKVGYKRIPLETFSVKDEEITRVFTTLTKQIGLDLSCYENPSALVMQATGQPSDDSYRCQTVVEYCISKTKNPVFRRGLPRTNDPVTTTAVSEGSAVR